MKLFIKTYGCKANQYDSQLLLENFKEEGYEVSSYNEADIVVVNTCCVTGKAEKEGRIFIRKASGEGKKVWVTGCATKRDSFLRKLGVDVYLISDIPLKKRTISFFCNHTRAFVKIEDGCDNFCTYCVVPYVRGRSRSRPEEEILEEVKNLCENGYKEIVLTGIDTGAYGRDTGTDIINLLEKLKGISGLERIRVSSIELFYLTDKICDYLVSSEIFCPHLHIPLQSGSDRILKMMGRKYKFSEYKERIEWIRERDTENRFTFTTDIMVGFPYEDDNDFSLSVKAVEEIGFLKVHIFRYSRREGTAAFSIGGDVSEGVKKEREKVLKEVADKVSLDIKRQFIDRVLDVLVERKKEGFWQGYSSQYLPVKINAGSGCLSNQIMRVKIEGVDKYGILHGKVI